MKILIEKLIRKSIVTLQGEKCFHQFISSVPSTRADLNEKSSTTRRRRRRPRPAPLSFKADTLTDESIDSSQSSLKSSSLSPPSSSPTNLNSGFSPQNIPLTRRQSKFKSSLRKSKKGSPGRQIEPPKSPGIVRSAGMSPSPTSKTYSPRTYSPRRNTPSPSPFRSPVPGSPHSHSPSPHTPLYHPGPCSPRSPNTFSSYSPRSPSPNTLRTCRLASQPTQVLFFLILVFDAGIMSSTQSLFFLIDGKSISLCGTV